MPSILTVHARAAQALRLRGAGDRFRGAVLVEIIVSGVDRLVRDGAIERELLVTLRRIEVPRGVRQISYSLGHGGGGRKCRRGCAGRQQECASIKEQMLRGRQMLRQFPATAAHDVHGCSLESLDRGSRIGALPSAARLSPASHTCENRPAMGAPFRRILPRGGTAIQM